MPEENDANRLTFLNDCLNKADRRIARLTAERDRWRDILAEVVGERNAEIMYRDEDRAKENPEPA